MFRNVMLALSLLIFGSFAAHALAEELVLAENGQSAYRIVVAQNASPSTKHGAEELQMFLEQITGAKLPIVSDREPQGEKEIILGDNDHLRALGLTIDFTSLGKEGYVIRTVGNHLVIAGGRLRGNMYGVYGFLQDHLGCRWFAPKVSHIPKSPRLAVGQIDDRQVPVLEYREPFTFECFDGDWCARNRMNSSRAQLGKKQGGKITYGRGFFAHTFNNLVPPEKYFDKHPEYFSLVKGKRLKEGSQLCCTNPEVVRICIEGVRKGMSEQPDADVFYVSQNDCYNYCECPKCQALARREGSQIAPVLQLVNRVAEAVENDFPDKSVMTLAYQWSRRAPKQMRPRPNVIIMLSSIECCFSHTMETCDCDYNVLFKALPFEGMFRDDLKAWGKVAERIWVWDYASCFNNYLLPFPNQRVRGPNIRFLIANNVKGIFEHDCYNTADSELWTLGAYMTAKLLWNPNYDDNKAMNEFLEGYYGRAAAPIHAYIDMLHDRVEKENIHVGLSLDAGSAYLTDGLLVKADELWQEAENLVAAEPDVLQRVKLSRMSIDYAIVERARLQAQGKLPANDSFMSLAVARFRPFIQVMRGSAITRLGEQTPLDKDTYARDLARDLRIQP